MVDSDDQSQHPGPGWWAGEDGQLYPPGDLERRVAGPDSIGKPLRDTDPTQLGPWQLTRRLGTGGMGVVYLGESNGDHAAVKLISSELSSNPAFRSRFEREVALCHRLDHPNVAAVLDADPQGEVPWLAVNYLPGPTLLEQVNRHGPLDADELRELADGVASALQAVHRVGVIHRDLKPSNIILSPDGPVVIDFGVAAAADATTLTSTGTALGSPGWMAPEQVRGEPVTPAADVFAWGATVAFAATGRPPFGTGRAEALAYRIVHQSADLDGVPLSLLPVVSAALANDPPARPDIDQVLEILDGNDSAQTLTTATPLRADHPTRHSDPAGTETAQHLPAQQPSTHGSGASKHPRVLLGAAGVALLAIVGFLVGQQLSRDSGIPNTGETPIAQDATASSDDEPLPGDGSADELPTSGTEDDTAPEPDQTIRTEELIPDGDMAVSIVLPHGQEPPALPIGLTGWRPDGPVETTEVRVFEGLRPSFSDGIGPSTNSCGHGLWTARWRVLNDDVTVVSAVEFTALADDPESYATALTDLPHGGIGYAAGFMCETPIFALHASTGPSTLADVVIEWQNWTPAV